VTVELREGVVCVEGRLAAMLHGPDDHRLLGVPSLRDAGELWADTFGAGALGEAEVGRADVTGELRFDDPRDGSDLLAAMRSLDLPWLKIGTEGWKRDRVETVYARTAVGRSVVLRAYDKGLETGTAEAGAWLRFERQRRFPKGRARDVSGFAETPLDRWFVGRELVKLEAIDDVTVCDREGAVDELRDRARSGDVSARTAERLAGFLALRGEGMSRATEYRRHGELSTLGIALDRNVVGRATVPIGGYLSRVVESFQAAA
jgi:hypothetical protein